MSHYYVPRNGEPKSPYAGLTFDKKKVPNLDLHLLALDDSPSVVYVMNGNQVFPVGYGFTVRDGDKPIVRSTDGIVDQDKSEFEDHIAVMFNGDKQVSYQPF